MIARIRGIFAPGWSLTVMVAITIAATVPLRPSAAAAVEYVRICTIFGSGLYYIPGTDTCVNPATNDAREVTSGGVWRWRVPNNPLTWISTSNGACQGGNLVKFGDVTNADLTLNTYSRYETNTHYQLKLKPGQYIGSVLYTGGFTGVEPGNFCMYYYYVDPILGPVYTPFGCIDTSAQANVPATLMFSPDSPIPPAAGNPTYVLGANGDPWNVSSASDIHGTLSISLCLQTAHPAGSNQNSQ